MGCNSCNNGSNGLPRGCNNNGNCASGSCGTFTVFDWLADISVSSDPFKIVEIRFKNGRKEYFRNNPSYVGTFFQGTVGRTLEC